MYTRYFSAIFCILLLMSTACVPLRNGNNRLPAAGAEPLMRADPGYVQYLEKLSLLQNSASFAKIVSGSHLNWRAASMSPDAASLLHNAAVWVHITPQSLLTPPQQSTLSYLNSPAIWRLMQGLGAAGLYISPTGEGAAVWARNMRNAAYGEDSIQYDFAAHTGTEVEYRALLATANKNRAILGMDTLPAATGLGPDFFLAGRLHRDFPGIYAMLELEKADWPLLPVVADEWGGEALQADQVQALHAKGLIPTLFAQDVYSPVPSGWAVTGEVRGMDGVLRRWIYRFYGDAKRPVLNWEDPSGTAMRILSASAIQQIGVRGGALLGLPLEALMGLELEGSLGQGIPLEPGLSAAESLGRAARRYGGWSWLNADIPLTQAKTVLQGSTDFIRDSAFSPAAEHALLTGDASLLHFMLDAVTRLQLDTKSFVHVSSSEDGFSYYLPHLRDAAARIASKSTAGLPSAPLIGSEAALFHTTILAQVMELSQTDNNGTALFKDGHLYTTGAGIPALALGVRNATQIPDTQLAEISKGHFMLNFFKAMQPGLYMLAGQDIAGVLPLSWQSMVDSPADWDVRATSRGAYALDKSSGKIMVSQQAIAQAATIYPTADVQLHDPNSFVRRLSDALRIRAALQIATADLLGRIPTRDKGTVALMMRLPDQTAGVAAITICNFSRSPVHETLSLDLLTAAGLSVTGLRASVAAGTGEVSQQGGQVSVRLGAWEACTVLLSKGQ